MHFIKETDNTAQVGGKTYRIETSVFFPDDISNQTIVVDSLGQRLTLNIENKRGGGGQRRISIFCPFWVVNTTEHALRYKQENSKMFVSGTVVSPTKNGSASSIGPDDFKYLNALKMAPIERPSRQIFSGTAGGLAVSKPGNCDLGPEEVARLLDSSLPLESLAELAFMFNFHDSMGAHRMSLQLGDGTDVAHYVSEWSRGLSLDSVGIPQVARYVHQLWLLFCCNNVLTIEFSLSLACTVKMGAFLNSLSWCMLPPGHWQATQRSSVCYLGMWS